MAKRWFDFCVALLALAVFLPAFIVLSLAIFYEDGRPIFFRQTRIGYKLDEFTMFKFRSMRGGRITRVGGWLRSTGLDEIVQFFHVLQGTMSVVGPRPLTESDLIRLGWFDRENQRFKVKPGVTGLSQLYAGRNARVSRFLDETYVKKHSLWMDMKIIILSFAINILGKKRIRALLSNK